ncbi:MAG: T9SS type A sorting domain-containing protein, partial [Spirosoma sp.]|nr:T9SS type A sorting domain-containing protein [Spirosoma sp.]
HHEAELPTNSLPPGPYILRLTDGSGEQTGRFIKK